MIRFAAVACVAVLLVACVPPQPAVTAHFEPRSSVGVAPTVGRAVVVYQDDVPAIMAAGAREYGTIEADGTLGDDAHMNDEVARFAASKGGTHVARVKSAQGREYEGSTPGLTLDKTGTAYAFGVDARYRDTNHAVYLVLVVPVADWAQLPQAYLPAEATTRGSRASAPVSKQADPAAAEWLASHPTSPNGAASAVPVPTTGSGAVPTSPQ